MRHRPTHGAKRGQYDHARAELVQAYCTTPRTMADIVDHFEAHHGAGRQARFAVYNLVRRGLLLNVAPTKASRGTPGLFICAAADSPHVPAAPVAVQRPFDTRALVAAWSTQP